MHPMDQNIMNDSQIGAMRDRISEVIQREEWGDLPEALHGLLWALSEARPDFDELPDWIIRQERDSQNQSAAVKPVHVVQASHSILRETVETYGSQEDMSRFHAQEKSILPESLKVGVDQYSHFLVEAADLISQASGNRKHLPLTLEDESLRIGRHTRISFNRTVRIPDDGKSYPLPAGLGRLPILRVEDYISCVPEKWRKEGGFIIPLYQREALFLEFQGAEWRPSIAKVGIGGVNAITGKNFDFKLREHRQDYVVIPEQKWLDGINSESGRVRQFVAMPLGQGYTVEAQITDEETRGGFQISVYDPKDGFFSDRSPAEVAAITRSQQSEEREKNALYCRPRSDIPPAAAARSCVQIQSRRKSEASDVEEMGIAAGGTIIQEIIEDFYGFESWDENAFREVPIHIVNSAVYSQITGKALPPSPITIEDYQKLGIPWYAHYEESLPKLKPAGAFKRILSIAQIDKKRIVAPRTNSHPPVVINDALIRRIHTPTKSQRLKVLLLRAKESLDAKHPRIAVRESSLCHDISGGTSLDALRIRAQAYCELKRYKDAEMDATLLLDKSPDDLFARSIRGWSRFYMKDFVSALRDAEAILSVQPASIPMLTLRARIHFFDWDLNAALTDAERVLQAEPENKILLEIQKIARTELGL